MSEINNNNFPPQIPAAKIDNKPIVPKIQEEQAAPKDTQKPEQKAELPSIGLPGRSQVKSTGTVLSDIDFFLKNPEMVEKANNFFEMTYNQLKEKGYPEAYETAAQITDAFTKEFIN